MGNKTSKAGSRPAGSQNTSARVNHGANPRGNAPQRHQPTAPRHGRQLKRHPDAPSHFKVTASGHNHRDTSVAGRSAQSHDTLQTSSEQSQHQTFTAHEPDTLGGIQSPLSGHRSKSEQLLSQLTLENDVVHPLRKAEDYSIAKHDGTPEEVPEDLQITPDYKYKLSDLQELITSQHASEFGVRPAPPQSAYSQQQQEANLKVCKKMWQATYYCR